MPFKRADREVDSSRFAVDGIHSSEQGLKAYLFSDRGIYRPGEMLHIGVMVKDSNWQTDIAGIPLKLEVMNSRGQIIDNKKVTLSEDGFLDYQLTTSETSATGDYTVSLYIGDDKTQGELLGSISVKVEDFVPDKMKITSDFSKKLVGGWVTPDNMKASISLQHLYGAPAVGRRVTAKISLVPGEFNYPQFKDYFFLSDTAPGKSVDVALPETVTDSAGKAEFPIDLSKYGNSTYRLTFYAEAYEPGSGKSVKTAKTILVSPRQFIVGVKADDNLNYIPLGETRKAEFLALDKELHPVKAPDLQLDTIRIDQISSLTRHSDGQFSYETKAVEKKVSTKPFAIDDDKTANKVDLTTDKPGDYTLQLSDKSGLKLAQVNYSFVGEGNVSASLNRNAPLKIALNKASYNAGDEIEFSLVAPYIGAGLVTIETDKTHAYKWFKTSTTSSTQSIKIPDDFEGKGFLSVQFVRSLSSPEIYMSPFTYGVVPFVSNIDKHDQKITLDAPKQVRPGDDLTITYKTAHKGKIIVYAVDEGILLFGHYKMPDPLNYFIGSRALEVGTLQIFDLLLPEFSMLKSHAAPGGDGWASDGKNMNPFRRKTEPPVAFWSGIIDSDDSDHKISFKIPDYFNGGIRIMAVGVSPEAMGAASTAALVKGNVVISPTLPLFAAPGDIFNTSFTLMNNIKGSGKDAMLEVTATPSEHLKLLEPLAKTIAVPEGQERTLTLKLQATDNLGSASVEFHAGIGDKTSHISQTMSVRPVSPFVTMIKSAYVKPTDPAKTSVPITRRLYPAMSSIAANVSAMPVSLIGGLNSYLSSYPYGCAEQITSKTFADVLLYNQPDLENNYSLTKAETEAAALSGIQQLRELQNNDGGFGMWSYYGDADELTTVYITEMLTVAREKGLPVPTEMLDKALENIKTIAAKTPESLADARIKAYAVYVITRNGEVTANYLPNIISYLDYHEKDKWHNDAAALYIAACYKMMQFNPEAEALIKGFKLGDIKYARESDFYDNLVKNDLYVSIISRYFPEHLADLGKEAIFRIINYIGEDHYSTYSSNRSIMAILDYSAAASQHEGISNLSIMDEAGQKMALKGSIIKRATLPNTAQQVVFDRPDQQGYFYQVTTAGFDKILPDHVIDDGIELSRRFLDDAGKPVTSVALGSEVNVELTLRSGTNQEIPNVAVLDLLPGGFEISDTKPQEAEAKAKEKSEDSAESEESTPDTDAPKAITPPTSSWTPIYKSKREDRMILYGTLIPQVQTYRYRIKAVSRGQFTTPPTYAESMYDNTIRTRGLAGSITVQ